VFAVKNRRSLIPATRNQDLYKYISGIVQNHNHKLLQVNEMSDHIHLLFGMCPTLKVQGFVKTNKVKSVIPPGPLRISPLSLKSCIALRGDFRAGLISFNLLTTFIPRHRQQLTALQFDFYITELLSLRDFCNLRSV